MGLRIAQGLECWMVLNVCWMLLLNLNWFGLCCKLLDHNPKYIHAVYILAY